MTKLTLLILAVLALAAPASAQGLVATSSVGGVLAGGQAIHPQPDLQERRALAMAAFKTPALRPRPGVGATVASEDLAAAEWTEIQAKDAWLGHDGLRILVNRIAYRTRF